MSSLGMKTQPVMLRRDPDADFDEDCVQFRLTYEGILLGASKTNTRADHKQEIRKVFHKQLRRLWAVTRWLNEEREVPGRAERFARNGYNFVPLITEELSLICGLHILFLRPDTPGQMIRSGDIDNRLKTLFDALRMPAEAQELGRYRNPAEDERPFFVLLQDDKLISQLSVETDLLLEPTGATEADDNDARLVITVQTRIYGATFGNLSYA